MSNVSNPSGPVNPTNPQRSSEPAKPGTDKFKDLMKIDKSDEKQKKSKKRPEETREEEKAKTILAGQIDSAKKLTETKKLTKGHKIQKVDQSQKRQPKQSKETSLEKEEKANILATPQKKPYESSDFSLSEQESTEETKKSEVSSSQTQSLEQIFEEEEQVLAKEETTGQFKQVQKQMEESKKETPSSQPIIPASSLLGPSFLAPAAPSAPGYTLLSGEMLALFERMIAVITVLQESGISETVIHLGGDVFANSPFSGSQIIIREYSTAPLSYNVEFMGNPMAAGLFRKSIPLLQKAFQEGKHRFRINRIDSSISKVERKEGSSGEESES